MTFPAVLDSNGKFIAHVARKFYRKQHSEEAHNNERPAAVKEEPLHIEVPTFGGKNLRLRLSKSKKFTAPGLVIEKDGHLRHHNPSCHYQGTIVDQPNSRVSLSYCQGLVSTAHQSFKYVSVFKTVLFLFKKSNKMGQRVCVTVRPKIIQWAGLLILFYSLQLSTWRLGKERQCFSVSHLNLHFKANSKWQQEISNSSFGRILITLSSSYPQERKNGFSRISLALLTQAWQFTSRNAKLIFSQVL